MISTESLLYYYKIYISQCKARKEKIHILPQTFYYLQPLFIYLYSVSFTHQSFLFTLFFLHLFYTFGKSGDLVNKNQLITYSNDISSYKIMKFFNHSAFHLIFYLKLFYHKSTDPTYKYIIFFLLQLFQCGIYLRKSYVRRYDFIQTLKKDKNSLNPSQSESLMLYPSYYKLPILTNNEHEMEAIIQKSSIFISENYYIYLLGMIHFFIYFWA